MRTAAVLPMRHTSERVPGKNYRPLGGIPLYHHITLTLLEIEEIDQIVIDTDSDYIKEDAAKHFPSVTILDRPVHLRDGAIAMNDVLLNTVGNIDADVILQSHSTNPFLKARTIRNALQRFATDQECDSLFSVTRLQGRLWDQFVKPVNHDPSILLRTQDLDPIYLENSCFYIFTKEVLKQCNNRIGTHPIMVEVDPDEAIDIDVEQDFRMAELMWAEDPKLDIAR